MSGRGPSAPSSRRAQAAGWRRRLARRSAPRGRRAWPIRPSRAAARRSCSPEAETFSGRASCESHGQPEIASPIRTSETVPASDGAQEPLPPGPAAQQLEAGVGDDEGEADEEELARPVAGLPGGWRETQGEGGEEAERGDARKTRRRADGGTGARLRLRPNGSPASMIATPSTASPRATRGVSPTVGARLSRTARAAAPLPATVSTIALDGVARAPGRGSRPSSWRRQQPGEREDRGEHRERPGVRRPPASVHVASRRSRGRRGTPTSA